MALALRRALTGVLAVLAAAAGVGGPPAAARADDAGSAGAVRFVKRTDPSFDRFTASPTPQFAAWMRAKFWRSAVFTPYFDARTAWYPQGWVYQDLYALYAGSEPARAHPEWILRDARGRPLYIPWGCEGGTCPQFAGDVGDPSFRRAWIDEARRAMAHGYRGMWIDDVNLEMRVGDGDGREVAPVDPRTATTMTARAWRGYVAGFVEEIRRALPGAELVHNSLWFAVEGARDADPDVRRQIAAADYLNLERGVNDDGLTGGTGPWSLQALLGFVDRVHAAGRAVVLDGGDDGPEGREYSLAAYLLISTGRDGLGLGSVTPDTWWPAFDADLGAAAGPRRTWQGLLRRDFAGGIALVNEPGAPARTVALPGPMLTTDGTTVTSVRLAARRGAVLRHPAGVGAAGGPAAYEGSSATGAERRAAHGGRRARVTLALRRRAATRRVLLSGRVRPAVAGTVRLRVERRRRGRWVAAATRRARVGPAGRFRATAGPLGPGRYRLRAAFRPRTPGAVRAATAARVLRLR
jgi:hypothetical protein